MNEVPVPPMPNDPVKFVTTDRIEAEANTKPFEFHDPFYEKQPVGHVRIKIDQWDLRIAVYSKPSWWTLFKMKLLGIKWEEA